MQAKGLVKFFGIALALVCLFQLSFTFVANRVTDKAEAYATAQTASQEGLNVEQQTSEFRKARRRYLDSVSTESVYPLLGYDYDYVKERKLNLGLDLQGGMSVVLQVTLDDVLRSLAGINSEGATFKKALTRAKELQKENSSDLVTLFGQAYKEQNPSKKLADIFATSANQGNVSFETSDADVLAFVREKADGAVNQTFKIIRTRIDKFGVTQPNVSLQPSTGRIVVELPGVDDPDRVRQLLQATAKLGFWEVYENSPEFGATLVAANDALKKSLGIEELKKEDNAATDKAAKNDSTDVAANDTTKEVNLLDGATADSDSLSQDELRRQNPLLSVFGQAQTAGPVVGYINAIDTSKFNEYMKMPEVKAEFPEDIKLLLAAKPIESDNGSNIYPVYAIQSRFGNVFKAPLEGDAITSAKYDYDFNQNLVISMNMNQEGAAKWRKLTGENIGKSVAIVLDELVYSAPTVQQEISGGSSQITGQFDLEEAEDLSNILEAGKLPAPARIIEEAVVGPSLGQKSIRAGLLSLLVGMLLVLGFMIFYYSSAGIVANIALLLNLFFVIGVLTSMGAVLTLPGMAGIVLTIGMAVDANVIIFERIREELAAGSGIKKAITDGYSKSYSAIIDANVTTLITAAILFYFGLGPVLGFATVLMIGIFSSLFTAILITRLIIEWWMGKGNEMKYFTNLSEGAFKGSTIDFINKRKMAYVIGGSVIAIGVLSIIFKGFDYGVDFEGGRTYVIDFKQDVSSSDVTEKLTDVFQAKPLVRTYGGANQVKITTNHMIASDSPTADTEVMNKLHKGLQSMLGGVSYDDFTKDHLMSSQKVGPTIADDIRGGAWKATVLALLGIFLYIAVRFRKWQYGLAAVVTIIHDTLILLAIFSVFSGILPFSLEIDQTFIAALLTVIGYSINDTVVVFDRIREYLALNPKRNQNDVINDAINSTLSRTVVTSLTTLIVVLILFIFGGEVIRGMSFALLIGILVGTYSSIFVATPIVVDLTQAEANRRLKAEDQMKRKQKKTKKTAKA
ncbi:MAG: protein translocase subunit SecDF [Chitinophagales bacterium]